MDICWSIVLWNNLFLCFEFDAFTNWPVYTEILVRILNLINIIKTNNLTNTLVYLIKSSPRFDLLLTQVDSFEVLNLLIFIDLYQEGRDSDELDDITRIRTFLFELLLLKLFLFPSLSFEFFEPFL